MAVQFGVVQFWAGMFGNFPSISVKVIKEDVDLPYGNLVACRESFLTKVSVGFHGCRLVLHCVS